MSAKNCLFTYILSVLCCLCAISSQAQTASTNNWDDHNLYVGTDNKIEIAIPKNSNLQVSVSRGIIKNEGSFYIYRTGEEGEMTLFVKKGQTIIYQQTFTVLPYPSPKLCMSNYRNNKFRAQDFTGEIWAMNPLNNSDKLKVKELSVSYLLPGNYTGTIVFRGAQIKSAFLKLQQYNANKLWIESFKYTKPNGATAIENKPKACNCRKQSAQHLTTLRKKVKKVLEIQRYPSFYTTIANKNYGSITIAELQKDKQLRLHSFATGNLFGFKITQFEMTIMRQTGQLERFSSNTRDFTTAMNNAIQSLKAGDKIEFNQIKAQNIYSIINVSELKFKIE